MTGGSPVRQGSPGGPAPARPRMAAADLAAGARRAWLVAARRAPRAIPSGAWELVANVETEQAATARRSRRGRPRSKPSPRLSGSGSAGILLGHDGTTRSAIRPPHRRQKRRGPPGRHLRQRAHLPPCASPACARPARKTRQGSRPAPRCDLGSSRTRRRALGAAPSDAAAPGTPAERRASDASPRQGAGLSDARRLGLCRPNREGLWWRPSTRARQLSKCASPPARPLAQLLGVETRCGGDRAIVTAGTRSVRLSRRNRRHPAVRRSWPWCRRIRQNRGTDPGDRA